MTRHVAYAIPTVLLSLFSQSMVIFFFIGTGRLIKDEVAALPEAERRKVLGALRGFKQQDLAARDLRHPFGHRASSSWAGRRTPARCPRRSISRPLSSPSEPISGRFSPNGRPSSRTAVSWRTRPASHAPREPRDRARFHDRRAPRRAQRARDRRRSSRRTRHRAGPRGGRRRRRRALQRVGGPGRRNGGGAPRSRSARVDPSRGPLRPRRLRRPRARGHREPRRSRCAGPLRGELSPRRRSPTPTPRSGTAR